MDIRGTVLDVGTVRSVSTRYGERELAEPLLRPDDGNGLVVDGDDHVDGDGDRVDDSAEPVKVSLWGDWAETAELLTEGSELLVTDVKETEFRGERGYATTGDSYVVVEPSYLVSVTDVRSWVQCPRLHYLGRLSGVEHAYPVVKGTIVHEVFGDLLRGGDLETSVADRVEEAGLDLGLLDKSAEEVEEEVLAHASAIEGWLQQGTLGVEDDWRSEQTLISDRFGIRGRADAVRRGMPVELKTGKNTRRDPRFPDKVQAALYALLLGERTGEPPDTGTLLYTKNAAVERTEESGDLSPAKDFSIGHGLLAFVVRARNELAAMAVAGEIPTGYEGNAKCEYCFEQDVCQVVSGRLDQESKAGKIASPLPAREREYFDRFYRLIEEERRETHREFAKLWTQTAEERADDDRALIELSPEGSTRLEDGRWELRARRTSAAVSKLREGDLALASDGDPIDGDAEIARIERLDDEVIVTTDEPIELRRLDVYPSEFGSDRMLNALHDALLKGDARRKDLLFGEREPEFRDAEETYVENNAAQNRAVNLAVNAEDCALIHGPPGTGKTYTIARVVRALLERGDRVLLSAFTNRAVDNALEALREQGFEEFVRVGTESGVRADMREKRLETRGDPAERAAELREARVVAATTASCGSRILRGEAFDVALVDEASQLTEPATLAAINLADRFVLVGDHHQLPPVVRAENDLSRSLFERLIDLHPEASVLLNRQYRMAQRIQAFSSREFYGGALRPATGEVAGRKLADLEGVDAGALSEYLRDPVTFVDVAGDASAHTDAEEARAVVEVIVDLEAAGVDRSDVGVIAPFRAQVATITREVPEGVAVDTVDRFQGSSKEVIIVSFVASDDLEGPIFEDYRRLNVALTRPKRSLVLVGSEEALETDALYARMLEWAR